MDLTRTALSCSVTFDTFFFAKILPIFQQNHTRPSELIIIIVIDTKRKQSYTSSEVLLSCNLSLTSGSNDNKMIKKHNFLGYIHLFLFWLNNTKKSQQFYYICVPAVINIQNKICPISELYNTTRDTNINYVESK